MFVHLGFCLLVCELFVGCLFVVACVVAFSLVGVFY